MTLVTFAADPAISVSAKQRYPWNGLVDLQFTITGTSGTKYDTSFATKDMVGGTNIAMRTIRKSDGTAANVAKEQLFPGTYNWIWDAAADLTSNTILHEGFLTTSSTTLFTNLSLNAVTRFSAVFGGNAISHADGETVCGEAYNIKADGNGKSIQFQLINGRYLKCVCVHVEQSGSDIVGYIKWARYMDPTTPLGIDFDTAAYTEYTIATSDSGTGYGISRITTSCPGSRRDFYFDRVTVTGTIIDAFPYSVKFNANGGSGTMANESFTYGTAKALTANAFTRTGYTFQGWATSASGTKVYSDKQSVSNLATSSGEVVNLYAVWKAALYMVIDLSGGANASSYPVSYLDAVPSGGWSDVYKTTKLVLRRIDPGTFLMGEQQQCSVTLSKPFFIGVFEVTQRQYGLVMGNNPSSRTGNKRPVENVSWNNIRGTYNWPSQKMVGTDSFIGKLRNRAVSNCDLPTEAQWEYACRATTNSKFNNGGSSESDLRMVGRYDGNVSDGKGGYSSYHTSVGSYQPNNWGLYDMHGNVMEWCLDWQSASLPGGSDPTGAASGSYSGYRINRGGCWYSTMSSCTSFIRLGAAPQGADDKRGFRVCVTIQ